jgi:hypothetical protein
MVLTILQVRSHQNHAGQMHTISGATAGGAAPRLHRQHPATETARVRRQTREAETSAVTLRHRNSGSRFQPFDSTNSVEVARELATVGVGGGRGLTDTGGWSSATRADATVSRLQLSSVLNISWRTNDTLVPVVPHCDPVWGELGTLTGHRAP